MVLDLVARRAVHLIDLPPGLSGHHLVSRQIALRSGNVRVTQPNASRLNSELLCYDRAESPSKLVKCDPLFDTNSLAYSLSNSDQVLIGASRFVGENQIGRFRLVPISALLHSLYELIRQNDVLRPHLMVFHGPVKLRFVMDVDRPVLEIEVGILCVSGFLVAESRE
jgi:hypothetical protein